MISDTMRLLAAGSLLIVVPHVVGFTVPPLSSSGALTSLQPCSTLCRSRVQAALHTAHHGGAGLTTPRARYPARPSSSIRQGWSEGRGRRRRSWSAMQADSSTSSTTARTMMSQPTPAAEGADSDEGDCSPTTASSSSAGTAREEEVPAAGRPAGGLRLTIVGASADELGAKIADRHGLIATSMDKLMKGKKGRKTDNVKARAASAWLADHEKDAAGGAILTGFPTTAEQAELLEKQGVGLGQLVVVQGLLEEGEAGATRTDGDGTAAEKCLLGRYEGKAVILAAEEGPEKIYDSASRLLALSATPTGKGGDVVGDTAALPEKTISTTPSVKEVAVTLEGGKKKDEDKEARVATMSPSERASVQEFFTVKDPAAIEASKKIAEAKRAKKEANREKKRKANEAQRLDTPFYLAVAENKSKVRFRPPAPVIPSRITEQLPSAVTGVVTNTRLEFGPLVLDSPASDCLLAAGIKEPTGIQQEGMGPILNGESVILHAMTGSGKTLAFLLPLMQRWTPSLFSHAKRGKGVAADGSFKVVLALPTRELAVQVAREAVLLAGGMTASVELLVNSNTFHNLGAITAPIVVGSAKVLERAIRKSLPAVRTPILQGIKCIVVDEVDRLVDVLSKHAPSREVEKRKRHARPIAALLEKVLQAQPDVQVVACSATIGRPLRRELSHIIRRSSAPGSANVSTSGGTPNDTEADSGSSGFRVIRDSLESASAGNLANARAVTCPSTIRHYCVPLADGEFFSRLEALTAALCELQPRRPLIFVPPEERVTAVVAHLRRSAGDMGRRAIALHEAMGFKTGENGVDARDSHSSEAMKVHDKLTSDFRRGSSNDAPADSADAGDGGLLAEGSGIERLGEGEMGALLVTGEDSARGLHFDDVDFVFLMQKPRSPDEYVHLAGRTGRQGKTGTVVSLVAFEEFQKLKAWSSTLKVHFEPLDILNMANK